MQTRRPTLIALVLAGVVASGAAAFDATRADAPADPTAGATPGSTQQPARAAAAADPAVQDAYAAPTPPAGVDAADWYEEQVERGVLTLEQVPEQFRAYVERWALGEE